MMLLGDDDVTNIVPVALFAYARPKHLLETLACLEREKVPLLYVFSDGPRNPDTAPRVKAVREILHGISWCKTVVCERDRNWGLGRSILDGVQQVLKSHDSVIVFEDDLVCVPGTYQYLCAALHVYAQSPQVFSVTGWTHPRVTPEDVGDQPYFDGRSECWVWGTWARAWQGMDVDALGFIRECKRIGKDIYRYGADLPAMADEEQRENIWAVRWLYRHIVAGALCLRPPRSLVEHIGFDADATHASDGSYWSNPPLEPCPAVPSKWPIPIEHPACPILWRSACGEEPSWPSRSLSSVRKRLPEPVLDVLRKMKRAVRTLVNTNSLKMVLPPLLVAVLRPLVPSSGREANEWEYIPEGFGRIETDPAIKGWNVPSVRSSQRSRWIAFSSKLACEGPLGFSFDSDPDTHKNLACHNIAMSYGYVLGLCALESPRISMLDWGGGFGHYSLLNKALYPEVIIDYYCKDVGLLVAEGRALNPEAKFCTDEACLSRTYDLVNASTSLQYAKDWVVTLQGLAGATGRYLFITQLPVVSNAKSFVFVQRPYQYGYNTEYLAWCLNRQEFLDAARASGLQLVREFIVGFQPVIKNAPEQNEYQGFLFRPVPAAGNKKDHGS
ncbi:MAG: hypothetical protein LKG23_10660 [Nitrospira sp.]|nr:hypothetical protein [Nitrospira sp.]